MGEPVQFATEETAESIVEEAAPQVGEIEPAPKKPRGQSRFFTMAEGDKVIDQGTFLTILDGRTIAEEYFALIRRAKKGLLKRGGGGLSMTGLMARSDGSVRVDSSFNFDKRFQLSAVEAASEIPQDPEKRNWQATFSLKGTRAHLKLRSNRNPLDMKIAFDHGWLVNMSPSILPFYGLLGRYDLHAGGIQEFMAVNYAAETEQFGMGRNILEVEYLDPIEARDENHDTLMLDYFVCDEVPVRGARRDRLGVTRRLHLWADEERRLRKVVEAQAGVLLTSVRKEDAEPLNGVEPYAEMIWPESAS